MLHVTNTQARKARVLLGCRYGTTTGCMQYYHRLHAVLDTGCMQYYHRLHAILDTGCMQYFHRLHAVLDTGCMQRGACLRTQKSQKKPAERPS